MSSEEKRPRKSLTRNDVISAVLGIAVVAVSVATIFTGFSG